MDKHRAVVFFAAAVCALAVAAAGESWQDGSECLALGVCRRAPGLAGLPADGAAAVKSEMWPLQSAMASHWNASVLPLSFAAEQLFVAADHSDDGGGALTLWHGDGFRTRGSFAVRLAGGALLLESLTADGRSYDLTDDDLLVEDSGLVLGAEDDHPSPLSFEQRRDDCTDEFTVVDDALGQLVGRGCVLFRLGSRSTGATHAWFAGSAAAYLAVERSARAATWRGGDKTAAPVQLHWSLTSAHSRVLSYYHPDGFSERLWASLTAQQKQVLVTCAMKQSGGVVHWRGEHWFPECVRVYRSASGEQRRAELDQHVLQPLLRWPHAREAAAAMGRPGFDWSSWRLCSGARTLCVHADEVRSLQSVLDCPAAPPTKSTVTEENDDKKHTASSSYYYYGTTASTHNASAIGLVDVLPQRLSTAVGSLPRHYRLQSDHGHASVEQLAAAVRCVARALNMSSPRSFELELEIQPAALPPRVAEALAATTVLLNDLTVVGLFARYAEPIPPLHVVSVPSRASVRQALRQIAAGLLVPSPALQTGVWRVHPSPRHRDRLSLAVRATFSKSGVGLLPWANVTIGDEDDDSVDFELLVNQTGLLASLLAAGNVSLSTPVKLVANEAPAFLTLGSVLDGVQRVRRVPACRLPDKCLTPPVGLQLAATEHDSHWTNSTLQRLLRAAIFHKRPAHVNAAPVQPTVALARALALVTNVAWHDYADGALRPRSQFALAKLGRAARRNIWRVFAAARGQEEVDANDVRFFDQVDAHETQLIDGEQRARLLQQLNDIERRHDVDQFDGVSLEQPTPAAWAWYWPKISRVFFEYARQPDVHAFFSSF